MTYSKVILLYMIAALLTAQFCAYFFGYMPCCVHCSKVCGTSGYFFYRKCCGNPWEFWINVAWAIWCVFSIHIILWSVVIRKEEERLKPRPHMQLLCGRMHLWVTHMGFNSCGVCIHRFITIQIFQRKVGVLLSLCSAPLTPLPPRVVNFCQSMIRMSYMDAAED